MTHKHDAKYVEDVYQGILLYYDVKLPSTCWGEHTEAFQTSFLDHFVLNELRDNSHDLQVNVVDEALMTHKVFKRTLQQGKLSYCSTTNIAFMIIAYKFCSSCELLLKTYGNII